jgi:glycosyltransferase involved in cell wall biosynthesis
MNEAIAKNLTVVIPYFNHVKYFNARIDSILQQTVKPASIIVVDDASEFGIENIINEYTGISKLSRILKIMVLRL